MISLRRIISIFALIAAFALGCVVMGRQLRKTEEAQQELRRLLAQQFQQDVERAKRATADPCATVFYEVVAPPPDINGKPTLVMMGQEISLALDPSAYSLRPMGDRVELWMGFPSLEPGFRKIGEKFSPDSARCK